MRYLTLPGLDKPVSVIGLGTGTPKAFTPETYDRGAALLDAFLKAGGTCIDTAPIYSFGASEKTIGRWLRERGTREHIVLITKGCHPAVDRTDILGKPWVSRLSPEEIHRDLSESLERLQTDAIDIYLLHRDDERVQAEPLVDALTVDLARGRIRAFGVSNWSTERIAQANAYAVTNGLRGIVVSSPSLSLPRPKKLIAPGTRYAGDAERAWHAQTQLVLLAWSSLGMGFMNGRVTSSDSPDSYMARTFFAPDNFERLHRAHELAERKNATVPQIGLAFVLAMNFPTIALSGPSSVEHLQDILPALGVSLSQKECAYLDLETDAL